MVETIGTKLADAAVLESGRYTLHHIIASGGMASIHLGRMRTSAGVMRTVAIKRMHPHLLAGPDFASMFLDEARLAMRVQHPNVVTTFDVISTDAELLLVMDYVLGESLDGLLRAARHAGRLPPVRVVCSVLGGVLAGLHAAHEARDENGLSLGIVHRDVSPQNILVGVDGVARVLDFGVAKAAGRLHTTEQGQIKGKLAYMAPEQLASGDLDRRVDVFAAAAVLWEGLAGQRLFGADSPGAVVANVLDKEIVAPSRFNESVPAAIDAIVLRGLARHPDQRFASARDMAAALERACLPASPSEVGAWVRSEAEEAVGARAQLLADVESRSSSVKRAAESHSEGSIGAAASPPQGLGSFSSLTDADGPTRTTSSIAHDASRSGGERWSARRVTLVSVGVASLLVMPLVLARTSANRNDPPRPSVARDADRVTASEEMAQPTAIPAPNATAMPSSSSAHAASTDASPAAKIAPAPPHPSGAAYPAAAHPSAPRKPDCRNPFTIGDGGIRIPRSECF